MTTINEAREAVYERWRVNSPLPVAQYFFDNERGAPDGSLPWARLVVRHLGSRQETLGPPGGRRFRRKAAVMIQVFTLADDGQQSADVLVQAARAVFEGVSFSGLRFFAAGSREAPNDGKWNLQLVTAEFDYEETK